MEHGAVGERGTQPGLGVRNLPFGAAGMITYLIVEHERRVDILLVMGGAVKICTLCVPRTATTLTWCDRALFSALEQAAAHFDHAHQ